MKKVVAKKMDRVISEKRCADRLEFKFKGKRSIVASIFINYYLIDTIYKNKKKTKIK